jgi:hypothetical protein
MFEMFEGTSMLFALLGINIFMLYMVRHVIRDNKDE